MTRAIVRRDEFSIATYCDGTPGRPWLVALNSLAADHRMWDPQMFLLARTHRVLRIDMRGHGASGTPAGPYTFDLFIADVVAAIDAHGINRVDLLGLSLGGTAALGFALAYPERVNRMIVCSARADAPPDYRAGWTKRIKAVAHGGIQAIVDGTLARWFTQECDPRTVAVAREMMLATTPDGYIACAEALKEIEYLESLGRITTPVLYLVGELDEASPKEMMVQMAERTPRSEIRVVPRTAHLPNMENPTAFANALGGWLEEAANVELGRKE